MGQPLVSVHVVTYNQRHFIGETIESIASQDYERLEVVVSDDASTDGTDELVREAERKHPGRVVALTAGVNLGISGNSNRCLARCRGKYIAFVAGDDLMLPGKVRAQVAWFEERRQRALCAHDVEHFDSDSGQSLRLHSSITPLRTGKGVGDFLSRGYFSATSSIMVRADAVPARGFDERIRVHSDWKFAVDCLVPGGEFGYVPGVLGRYRRHPNNSTTRYSTLVWEEIHVGLAILEAEHPELISVWEKARAYAYYQRAVSCVLRGSGQEARRAVRNAVRHYPPAASSKLALWWAASFVPLDLLPARARGQRSSPG